MSPSVSRGCMESCNSSRIRELKSQHLPQGGSFLQGNLRCGWSSSPPFSRGAKALCALAFSLPFFFYVCLNVPLFRCPGESTLIGPDSPAVPPLSGLLFFIQLFLRSLAPHHMEQTRPLCSPLHPKRRWLVHSFSFVPFLALVRSGPSPSLPAPSSMTRNHNRL